MSAHRGQHHGGALVRDQESSRFAEILGELIASTPGAIGAALVDLDGETIDYAGALPPFDLKVAAAQWQIVFGELSHSRIGPLAQIVVRAAHTSYVVRRIHADYTVVLILHRWAAFSTSARALLAADVLLSAEAGWPSPQRRLRWFGVEVQTSSEDRSRPVRVRAGISERRGTRIGEWHSLEIMGTLVGLARRERGYRVRLATGAEMMLVREPLGRWFADEHFAAVEPSSAG